MWPSGTHIWSVLIPNTLEMHSESAFLGYSRMLEVGYLKSQARPGTLNMRLMLQDSSFPPLNTLPHGTRSLQGWGTYPLRDHFPGTHDPELSCPKWSIASLQGLRGSLPSQGQVTSWLVSTALGLRDEWPWTARSWIMGVNKTLMSRLAYPHTFLQGFSSCIVEPGQEEKE